jgi:hypothetical protein
MFKDETPKLCFLRHLLVHVHCTSHTQGHVFPETIFLVDEEVGPVPEFNNKGHPAIPTFPVTHKSGRCWINGLQSSHHSHGVFGEGDNIINEACNMFVMIANFLMP